MATSTCKEFWAQWDNAWDLGLPAEKRLEILKNATAPGFTYTNPTSHIPNGNLEEVVQLIGQMLQGPGKNMTVKHLNWWEHHGHSALHWDMVDVDSGEAKLRGFSHGRYAEDGKLLSVTDFW
ncbi:hypothetical protein PV08_01503 [Exophiala spinifera]|uniref:SnoaL-like domain-containing protein n=1 Tax=Exophiala spinifera TaxID=91928 RepID=A0A0D2CBN6_9EURO|nr:uncharacterized protein PV08_01503 [Exophiala spinifera]KIW20924.1 hypothetical protein PV08_01503 [Exophiala spinifera]